MKFFITHAFSKKTFGGNPAGVVLVDVDEGFPSTEKMIQTAKELRYSETVFIKQVNESTFYFRYFTPTDEVDLCGHATIGGFFALLYEDIVKSDKTYTYKTNAGILQAEIDNTTIFMDMATPQFIKRIENQVELARLYETMGIPYIEEHLVHPTSSLLMYPEIISTGLPDILLPVKDEKSLNMIEPDFDALVNLSKEYQVIGVHAFTLNSKDNTPHCRNFAPLYGINEESATGTANGALTYYLYRQKVIDSNDFLVFIQGEKMNRTSHIQSKISVSDEGDIKIQVGGTAAVFVKGSIFLE